MSSGNTKVGHATDQQPRPITRLLVANRGEIARRVFRTARAMGIETVAIHSDGDADAPFVAEADVAVALGGRSATDSYLDAAKVLDAARRSGADAIHPGYGFLSENAAFAQAVIDAGIAWVGPPPSAIAAMGDKIEAKTLMMATGVPTLPSVIIIDGTDIAAEAAAVGYPVLIKAAAGGGGKGMRVVNEPDELAAAIEGAQREALNSFGNDTVFLEKYLPAPRHIEIQVLGDTHGNLIHCFERECSIQRRHQKVVEEAPSPVLPADTRARMGQAAVDAVAAVGYRSAGTVEFLYDDETDEFYFLEVNTRLQVEHPVTEEITGLDLVRQQILVAQGQPLTVSQDDLSINGHAIEVRLYAEDPDNDFLPAVGTLDAFAVPAGYDIRLDTGVEQGSEVSVEFDPMLAKVIAWAPTRTEAAQRLALALERTQIAGVVTNRDFLVATLRHAAYLAGETRTDFIARHQPATRFLPSTEAIDEALVAAALYSQQHNRNAATALAFLRSGYRNSNMPPQELRFVDPAGDDTCICYASKRDGSFSCTVGAACDRSYEAAVVECDDTSVVATIDGVRRRFTVARSGLSWQIQAQGGSGSGAVVLTEIPRFPDLSVGGVAGGQTAPMPGVIRAVSVAVGDQVAAGQALVVMEAMKMEHTIAAPEAATVTEVRCAVGDQVDNGAVLVVLEALTD